MSFYQVTPRYLPPAETIASGCGHAISDVLPTNICRLVGASADQSRYGTSLHSCIELPVRLLSHLE